MLRKLAAELLGTLILVFIACGVATLSFGKGFNFAGFSLVQLVRRYRRHGPCLRACPLGPRLRPGADLGMPRQSSRDHRGTAHSAHRASRGRPLYGRPIVGGILGALLLWGVFSASPFYHRTVTGLGADGYGKASDVHISAGGAFLVEVILTAIFVFVILGVTSRIANALTAGLVIGLTLTFVHLIGIPLTGTSVNPARSLGPALVVGGTALSQVWLFIVAPAVGGVVAAIVHWVIYPKDAPEAEESLDPETAA